MHAKCLFVSQKAGYFEVNNYGIVLENILNFHVNYQIFLGESITEYAYIYNLGIFNLAWSGKKENCNIFLL